MDQYNITYRKKDNSWGYVISYKDGLKWKQKSKQGFELNKFGKIECKDAAEKMVEELKKKAELQPATEYAGIKFKEFADMFVEHERLYKEQNTTVLYENALKSFESLYKVEVSHITTLDIQRCVDELIKKQLKASTIKAYTSKINIVLKYAIQMNLIISNPTQNINLPKAKVQAEKTALTKSELNELLNKIKNRKHYIISLLASNCGLRIGEIMGLTWDNVDVKNGILVINQQWKKLKNGEYGFGTLKTLNSKRTIPVPPNVLKELIRYENEMPININKRIVNYKSNSEVSIILLKLYKRLGFDISVHELRHTYATTLIANGVDFKTVAKLMGHDVEQTIKTYSHVTDDMMKNATALINKIF